MNGDWRSIGLAISLKFECSLKAPSCLDDGPWFSDREYNLYCESCWNIIFPKIAESLRVDASSLVGGKVHPHKRGRR